MKTKKQKQEEAVKRQQAYEIRTIQEQLDYLNTRPGEAKRERARLLDRLFKVQKEFHEQ